MKAADLAALIITITEYAIKFGITAAVQIVSGWMNSGEGVTAEDFRRLREDHKAPEEFLSEEQRRILGLAESE